MKEEELMIGDFVYYSPSKYATKVMEVRRSVDEWYIRCIRDAKDTHYEAQLEDFNVGILRPIPLTKEILEKNEFYEIHKDEFEKTRTHMYALLEHEGGFVVCGSDDYGYYLGIDLNGYPVFVGEFQYHNGRYVQGEYPINNLKYVHQLQHMLNFFNVEKEIKL